mgnify:CR=1 FL=1
MKSKKTDPDSLTNEGKSAFLEDAINYIYPGQKVVGYALSVKFKSNLGISMFSGSDGDIEQIVSATVREAERFKATGCDNPECPVHFGKPN